MDKKRTFTDKYIESLPVKTKKYKIADLGCRGLALIVNKGGTKTFTTSFRDGKRIVTHTIGVYPRMNVDQARLELSKIRDKRKKEDRTIDRPVLVRELWQLFREQRLTTRAPESLINADSAFRVHINPGIGHKRLNGLITNDCSKIITGLRDDGHPTHANTVRALMGQMFRWGKTEGLISDNPMDGASQSHYKLIMNEKERYLTMKEVFQFVRALDEAKILCAKLSEQVRLGLLVMLLSGVRGVDVRRTEIKDVNFDEGWWRMKKMKIGNANVSGKIFYVPLNPWLTKCFKDLIAIAGNSKYVFPGNPNSHSKDAPITSKVFRRALERMFQIKKPDGSRLLTMEEFSPHDFRRTIDTNLVDYDIDSAVVSTILNHSPSRALPSVAMKYQKNQFFDQRKKAMKLWEDLIWEGTYEEKVIDFKSAMGG